MFKKVVNKSKDFIGGAFKINKEEQEALEEKKILENKSHKKDEKPTIFTKDNKSKNKVVKNPVSYAPKAKYQSSSINPNRISTVVKSSSSELFKPSGVDSKESEEGYSVVRIFPQKLDDATEIMDLLKEGKQVIVNFEQTAESYCSEASDDDPDKVLKDARSRAKANTSQRIFDTIAGVIYILRGSYIELSSEIFVFLPKGSKFVEHGIQNKNPEDKFQIPDTEEGITEDGLMFSDSNKNTSSTFDFIK